MAEIINKELTDKILRAYYNVYNELGYGFLEKVYENAMAKELNDLGLSFTKQKPISVYYKNEVVGEYFADLVIDNKVIVELKACEILIQEHEFQLINYLKATNMEIGLLLNFGKKPDFKRKIFTNDKK